MLANDFPLSGLQRFLLHTNGLCLFAFFVRLKWMAKTDDLILCSCSSPSCLVVSPAFGDSYAIDVGKRPQEPEEKVGLASCSKPHKDQGKIKNPSTKGEKHSSISVSNGLVRSTSQLKLPFAIVANGTSLKGKKNAEGNSTVESKGPTRLASGKNTTLHCKVFNSDAIPIYGIMILCVGKSRGRG